jgi:hypothetical protein
MKNHLLLPHACRTIGYILLPFVVTWLLITYYGSVTLFDFLKIGKSYSGDSGNFLLSPDFHADMNLTISMLLTLMALFMIAFSRERTEDEYIRSVRLRALQVSVYANYIILALACVFLYDTGFLTVMEVNLFTILVIFIVTYQYILHIKPRFAKQTDL